jgi:hypothetical protein
MTSKEFDRAVGIVDKAFAALASVSDQGTVASLKATLFDGKLYELRVIAWLLGRLKHSGWTIRLIHGPHLQLKSKPGFIKRSDPYLLATHTQSGTQVEIWSNVQFIGIGFRRANRNPAIPLEPDYHELDIAVTFQNVPDGFLRAEHVLVAIECKDRFLKKGMLREMLGLRRELSYLHSPSNPNQQIPLNGFTPITTQDPPSRLFLCTSSPPPNNYAKIAPAYAIHVEHVTV